MRRYLIVDDNQAFAENVAEILTDAGAEVTIVAGGPQALEAARSRRFDALVTDMRMPVMSGARLVHEIRAVDPGLPAIVVTAYTGEDDLLAARDEGLLAVLPKPAPIPRLLELLRNARRDGLVALVEDDPALADNLAEALRDRGFSAVTAHSVAETGRLGGVRPFAALVDIRVKGGSDGEALRTVLRQNPGLPVLAMTAFPDCKHAVEAIPVFEKPFHTGKLLDAIEEVHEARQ
ncbi:MAG: response regulator [Deltaproteobacteria bacterium]|nr:MAG: response regulator [Deltaproteobacteria bacterium]